jgi:CIC family chloride channel protein
MIGRELAAWWSGPDSRRPRWPQMSRERLRRARRRWHRALVLSLAVGVAVGLATAGFEWITAHVLLEHVLALPEPALIFVPGFGLLAATLLIHKFAHTTPSISDDYLRAYHERPRDTSKRTVAARIAGAITTLGSGVAMGFEGPAIYLGSTIGSWFQTRYHRFFTERDRHALLVAGAAAGVAAIFKAPATGAVFALEVPYQQDTASHAVLPAIVAAASSYLTYVAFYGTGRLFAVAGAPAFDARDLLGGIALGLACGVGARGFAWSLRAGKRVHARRAWRSAIVAAGLVAAVGALGFALFSRSLTIGPGYNAIHWSLDPTRSLELVAALLVLRSLATVLGVSGGGAGGLFIPLVVEGWLLGRCAEGIAETHTALFPVIGAAAFLGAGYRTPIAETTGRPGFIVPGLVATAVAQLAMGSRSVTDQQLERRVGSLDRRLEQPVRFVMDAPPPTCHPEARLRQIRDLAARSPSGLVAVIDDDRLVGAVTGRTLLAATSRSVARELVDPECPMLDADMSLGEALSTLRASDHDSGPVIDDLHAVIGSLRAVAFFDAASLGGDTVG